MRPSPAQLRSPPKEGRCRMGPTGGKRRLVSALVVASAALSFAPGAGAATVPSGSRGYVPSDDGNVTVVDLVTMTPITTIGVGIEPRGCDATPDQAFVFVANSEGSILEGVLTTPTVSMIDTTGDFVTQTIILTRTGAYDCAVTPDGSKVYVVCNTGYVCVVDVATRQQVKEIAITAGGNAESLAVSPSGAKVYVTNRTASTVEVIDTATDAVVGAPIAVTTAPRDVAFSTDGAKAIVVGDSAPTIIDATNDTIFSNLSDDLGQERHVVCVGNLAYVTNLNFTPPGGGKLAATPGAGSIDVYDLENELWVESLDAGVAQPYGIDVLPGGGTLFPTSKNDFKLGAFDLDLGEPVNGQADTSGTSRGVAVISRFEVIDSFFLPKKVAYRKNPATPAKSVLKASGFFDTGSKEVDLTAAATLTVGKADFNVPSLTASPDGRTFRYDEGGLKFTVVKNPFGSSRAKFRLQFTGDLGDQVPTDGDLLLRFHNDAVDGACRVKVEKGGFRIGKKRGSLSVPNLFVVRSHAEVPGGGKDTLAIIVGLATGGATPAQAADVNVRYGDMLDATVPADSFDRVGDKYVFKGNVNGITSVTMDYARETVTIVGKGLDLGTFPVGQSPLTIVVGVGEDERGVAVRVSRKGDLLKY